MRWSLWLALALTAWTGCASGPKFVPASEIPYYEEGVRVQLIPLAGPCYVGVKNTATAGYKMAGGYKSVGGKIERAVVLNGGGERWSCLAINETGAVDLPGSGAVRVRATEGGSLQPVADNGSPVIASFAIPSFKVTKESTVETGGSIRVREVLPQGKLGSIYVLETPIPTQDDKPYDVKDKNRAVLCRAKLTALTGVLVKPKGMAGPGSYSFAPVDDCTLKVDDTYEVGDAKLKLQRYDAN